MATKVKTVEEKEKEKEKGKKIKNRQPNNISTRHHATKLSLQQSIEQRISTIESRFDHIEQRLDRIERISNLTPLIIEPESITPSLNKEQAEKQKQQELEYALFVVKNRIFGQ